MSKLNLIIDASYFCNRTIHSINEGDTIDQFLNSKEDQVLYVKKLMDDIKSTLSIFNRDFTGRLIWVQDDKSWRKELPLKTKYKSNRDKSGDQIINWDMFYALNNEFADTLEKIGIIVSRIPRAEADDLIYLWANHLLSDHGESSIIITGDGDMNQCTVTTDKGFICVYNPKASVASFVLNEDHREYLQKPTSEVSEDNYFGLFDYDKEETIHQMFKYITKLNPIKWINSDYFIYNKVLIGDKSDTVPSVVTWKSKTGNMTFSVTDKKSAVILSNFVESIKPNEFPSIIDLYNGDSRIFDLAQCVINETKVDTPINEVVDRIKENILVMVLHNDIIPEDIIIGFNSHIKEAPNKTPLFTESKILDHKPEWKYTPRTSTYTSDIFNI